MDVNGEMRLRFGLRSEGKRKYSTNQEKKEQTAEASQETRRSVSKSDQAGKSVPGAAIEREPIDFASAAIAGDHDRLHTRERAQTFGAMIPAVAAQTISTKCSMRICDITDDVIDAAASGRELGSDATGTRLIVSPDTAAERKGALVSKCNGFGLVSESSHTEHGAEGFFGKDAGFRGNVGEERRIVRGRGTILRQVQRGSARECVFDLGMDIRSRVLSQREEVRVWISINAQHRDPMLEAGKKIIMDGRFTQHTFYCNP